MITVYVDKIILISYDKQNVFKYKMYEREYF